MDFIPALSLVCMPLTQLSLLHRLCCLPRACGKTGHKDSGVCPSLVAMSRPRHVRTSKGVDQVRTVRKIVS